MLLLGKMLSCRCVIMFVGLVMNRFCELGKSGVCVSSL